MKLTLVSDLHGYLPESLPKADVLVIAGDICPVWNHKIDFQRHWLNTDFRLWLEAQDFAHVVAVWGNHDWIGQKAPHLVPQLPWNLLTDSSVVIDGKIFYGTPWQLEFCDWAFNLNEADLAAKHDEIPHCDVLISHGPPYGAGDTTTKNGPHLGAASLLEQINELEPSLVVCGHIHGGYGVFFNGKTMVANAAIMDEQYRPVNTPIQANI